MYCSIHAQATPVEYQTECDRLDDVDFEAAALEAEALEAAVIEAADWEEGDREPLAGESEDEEELT